MSVICQTFIQNSWKKDICSNCFKTLEDHLHSPRERNRYYLHSATPYHSHHHHQLANSTDWKNAFNSIRNNEKRWSIPKVSSILKDNRSEQSARNSVVFLDQEPDIIGFGGEDYQLDGYYEDWDDMSDDGEFNLEKLDETDEDRAITKITKENTRFNTHIDEEDNRKSVIYEQSYPKKYVTRTDDSYYPTIERREHFNENDYRLSIKNNRDDTSDNDIQKYYYLPRVFISSPANSSSSSGSYYNNKSRTDTYSYRRSSPKPSEVSKVEKESVRSNSPAVMYNSIQRKQKDEEINSSKCRNGSNRITNGIELPSAPVINSPSPIIYKTNPNHTKVHNLSRENSNASRNKNLLPVVKTKTTTDSEIQAKDDSEPGGQNFINPIYSRNSPTTISDCVQRQQHQEHTANEIALDKPKDPLTTENDQQDKHDFSTTERLTESQTSSSPPGEKEKTLELVKSTVNETENPEVISIDEKSSNPSKILTSQQNNNSENSAISNSNSLHYAVSQPLAEVNHYAESLIYDANAISTTTKPTSDRETRLAALAIELEQARHNNQHKQQSPRAVDGNNTQTDDPATKPVIYHQKNMPDLEDSQKNKKSRFSLKKLLKRNKEPENTDTINSSKAWKLGDYDRSTLRLKIIHPMDLIEASNQNVIPSTEHVSDPPEDKRQANESNSPTIQSLKQERTPAVAAPRYSSSLAKTGSRSERPSKPPPPPRILPVRPKSVDFVDLTVPITNGYQKEKSNRNSMDDNIYDVPKNIPKREVTQKPKKEFKVNEEPRKIVQNPPHNKEELPHNKEEPPSAIKESNDEKQIASETMKHSTSFQGSKTDSPKSLTYAQQSPQPNDSSPYAVTPVNKLTPKPWITLEYSYAVVTAANHEVLAKFLDTAAEERSQQLWKPESGSLQWSDFEFVSDQPAKVINENNIIIDATFKHGLRTEVTLLVTKQNLTALPCGKGDSTYPVLGSFSDHFPSNIISATPTDSVATIHILQRSDVDTLQNACSSTDTDIDVMTNKIFILLQLIQFLKIFQTRNLQGLPELENIFVLRTNEEMDKVVFLNNVKYTEKPENLCQFALSVMRTLFYFNTIEDLSSDSSNVPMEYRKVFTNMIKLLNQDKPFSLMQCQSFTEYALWGPTNIVQNCKKNLPEIDICLQRWLDTERAKCLKLLVRTLCRPNVVSFLSAHDEHHADFLLRTSVRSLREVTLKS